MNTHETAPDHFHELESAVGLMPDCRKVYQVYNQVFRRFLNAQTAQAPLVLAGTFAKTDYLLKESQAPRKLAGAVNDTRVRLRKYLELTEADLQRFCLFDLKNLCQFIAFLCDCHIPPSLTALFPTQKAPSFTPALVSECMRLRVERWDDEYIFVQTEESTDGETVRVCYARDNQRYPYDWTYLKDLLSVGAQLNLVRPRMDDGVLWPELIVFEPDYLVNISTVAHCFTNYADSPFVELIKMLEPAETTEPMVLGNLAGQFLDESIHYPLAPRSYTDSVKEFFRDNAVKLLTAGVGNRFHEEAKCQKQHIDRAIHEVLPAAVQRFDAKDGLVEPSFYSEMLGLQGRMDYLQMDFKVLLEQKSGKGGFPYDHFRIPRQTDEHYVQLLLYMALVRYNYREAYDGNGQELHAFLLYSKYTESLLGLGFSPELLFKAMKVRNGIAYMGLRLAQPDGFRILDTLTPDRLNEKKVDNRLWKDYQQPQIAAVLDPIRQASELERAYYFRFQTFIAQEHVLSKLGNRKKEGSGFAATWHDTLSDKRMAGNIYDQLTLEWPQADTTGSIGSVVLRFSETEDNDMSNFRTGDIVILYPYTEGTEPDARRTMVFRCTIEDIQTETIRLALRSAQTDNRVFLREQGKRWAIEHDFLEASYSSLYKGMQAFLSAPKARRDLLLLQRKPQTDASLQLKGDYGMFNEMALRVKQARDLFLIIGPPGTGKTSFGLLSTVQEELREPDTTVLLTAYTNRAVDEICGKLVENGIPFIRLGVPFSCAEAYRDRLLGAVVQDARDIRDLKNRILAERVFVATTTSLNANLPLFRMKQFSLAVIDEASQILEPQLMGLLCANNGGVPAIRKFVLIGDHKQLPAVVQQEQRVSQVHEPILHDILLTDCRSSLFERMLRKYGNDPHVTYMLTRQGRMHHDIAAFPNQAFYNNRLVEVPRPHQLASLLAQGDGKDALIDLLATRRIMFLASDVPLHSPTDKVNLVEADIIADIVVRIYQMEKEKGFDPDTTVGVIVPYRNQIAAIRKALASHVGGDLQSPTPLTPHLSPLDITIDTVERYQGSQRKYIVYGFTVQKRYQLDFLTDNTFRDTDGTLIDRKLNVAMTRAEEHLILVGNPELLAQAPVFHQLITFLQDRHCLFNA